MSSKTYINKSHQLPTTQGNVEYKVVQSTFPNAGLVYCSNLSCCLLCSAMHLRMQCWYKSEHCIAIHCSPINCSAIHCSVEKLRILQFISVECISVQPRPLAAYPAAATRQQQEAAACTALSINIRPGHLGDPAPNANGEQCVKPSKYAALYNPNKHQTF